MSSRLVSSLALALSTALSACGGPGGEAETPERRRVPPGANAGRHAERLPSLPATELARVPSVTYGPYLSVAAQGALVVWAALEGNARRFTAAALGATGQPLAPPKALAAAPETMGVVAVRPFRGGYVVIYTRPSEAGESLEAFCVSARGDQPTQASVLTKLAGRALWVEAAEVADGVLLFHAARPGDDGRRAHLGAVPLDAACRPAPAQLVLDDALAWQAVSLGDRAVLAAVRASSAGSGGVVQAFVVDAAAKQVATAVVSAGPSADLDLDAGAARGSAVIAWTDRRALEPRLVSAVVDGSGKLLVAPQPLTAPEGEQSLVRIVPASAGSDRLYVAWENVAERPHAGRTLQLSALEANGRLTGARGRLEYASDDGGMPEFAASARGLASLTLAPACRVATACDAGDIAPVFVELDVAMTPIATEPLRLSALGGARAELGFGLGCSGTGCFAIAALARTPAPIFVTALGAHSKVWRAPFVRIDENARPRVVAHEALTAAESFAGFALASVEGQEYLGTITDFDPTTPWRRLMRPAVDGRYEPLRARVALERLTTGLKPAEAVRASPLSLRAHSLGGIALAAGDAKRGELLAVWAGLDQGVPQVFLTLVGKNGDRLQQRMLTRKKGDLEEIALAWVGDGFLVAWVDERFGDPEVIATKLDARLNRSGPEQRISDAPGTASDLTLAFDGTQARLAWSDARAAEVPGQGDIYSAAVSLRDAARIGDELRVAATRTHSFSPSLAPRNGGFAIAWVERGDPGADSGRVMLAQIGADAAAATALPASAEVGEPRSVGLSCEPAACRVAAILERQQATELDVGTWTGTEPARLTRVLSLTGASGATIAPVLRGDAVLFVDGAAGTARVRRARVAW